MISKLKDYWAYAAERAIKTFAQVAVATIGVGVAIASVDWVNVVSVAALASIISLLTSVSQYNRPVASK